MTTQELLDIDMTEQKNKEIICRMLYKLKPMQKLVENPQAIKMEHLEKVLQGLCSHYNYGVQTIYPYFEEKKFVFYCASITKKEDTTLWKGNIYGKTIYEVFAKLIIKIYSEIKKEKKA